jgi:hypothetical protein
MAAGGARAAGDLRGRVSRPMMPSFICCVFAVVSQIPSKAGLTMSFVSCSGLQLRRIALRTLAKFPVSRPFGRPFLDFWIVATEATADKFCRQ